MEEYKGPQEEPEYTEEPEEYSFLQEVIKDEAGGVRSLKAKILRVIGFGFIFGVVASISFCALMPWAEKRFESDPDEVTIPRDEREEPEEETVAASDDPVSEEISYSRMIRSLNSISVITRRSVVEVASVTPGEKGAEEERHRIAGVVVADNGQELLILGQMFADKEAEGIQAVFFDGLACQAAVKMSDANLELCIYAVRRADVEEETLRQIQAVQLGSSFNVDVGDVAILLGKPFGQEDAAGYGIIESCEDYVERADGRYEVLSVSAAGFGGGSGIIVDADGKVIGLISQSVMDNANGSLIYGYAISNIKDIIEFLSNGTGVPYIGVCGTDVTDEMAEDRGIPKGVYVKEVEANSPAMAAGIQSGDIITQIDGTGVNSFDVYHNILMTKKGVQVLNLKGCRQGAGDEYVDIDFSVNVGTKK